MLLNNMLKQKLQRQAAAIDKELAKSTALPGTSNSELFPQPFWRRFYEIEYQLNEELATLELPNY